SWTQWSRVPTTCFAALVVAGCGGATERGSSPITLEAAGWAQADVLFRRDPRWLGSDGAYSIPLTGGRILWLFEERLVAPTTPYVKKHAYFVRNTVAIERGSDPTTASMTFYWRGRGSRASSFFREQGPHWYWPAHGIQVGRALV